MAGINIFKLKNNYVFKQFLNDRELFIQLGDYYNKAQYRFEIPEADLEKVQDILQAAGYDITIIDNPKEFVVTIGRFQKHKEILKNSVDVEEVGDDKIFLMKDHETVEMALSMGATKYEGDLFS
jgi:hypothetical protein